MAAKARATKAAPAAVRCFDMSAELRATAHRRKHASQTEAVPAVTMSLQEGVPEISERLAKHFPDFSVDVVRDVTAQTFRSSPNMTRQQLESTAMAKLIEMSVVDSGSCAVSSLAPKEASHDAASLHSVDEGDIAMCLDPHLASLLALENDELIACLKTLVSVLSHIEERPEDARVRRLRRGNKKFHAEICRHEAALELLRAAGFKEEGVEEGDPAFSFHGKPGARFARVKAILEGSLESMLPQSFSVPVAQLSAAAPVLEAPHSKSSSSFSTREIRERRQGIAALTEQRLRDPRGFREAAKARGVANPASGKAILTTQASSAPATADRRAQHFTLADIEQMRIADEIASTTNYAEEYQRMRQNAPVDNYSSLVARSYDLELIARQALDFTNKYRASNGLAPCRWNAGIARIAAEHASQMASGSAPFSHDGFDDRVRAFPLYHLSAAENLAFNKGVWTVAETAVDGWIKSPGHEKNLRGAFNVCGIGVARASDGSFYLTQLFASAV